MKEWLGKTNPKEFWEISITNVKTPEKDGKDFFLQNVQNLFNKCHFASIIPSEPNNALKILINKKKGDLMKSQMIDLDFSPIYTNFLPK